MKASIVSFLMAAVALSGCATKRFVTTGIGEVSKKVDHLST